MKTILLNLWQVHFLQLYLRQFVNIHWLIAMWQLDLHVATDVYPISILNIFNIVNASIWVIHIAIWCDLPLLPSHLIQMHYHLTALLSVIHRLLRRFILYNLLILFPVCHVFFIVLGHHLLILLQNLLLRLLPLVIIDHNLTFLVH